jgi:hypothetical protein
LRRGGIPRHHGFDERELRPRIWLKHKGQSPGRSGSEKLIQDGGPA